METGNEEGTGREGEGRCVDVKEREGNGKWILKKTVIVLKDGR